MTGRTDGLAALEPGMVYELLGEAHLPNLDSEQSRILAARVCGWNPHALAMAMFRDEREMRRKVERLEALICAAVGMPRDAALVGHWFPRHIRCKHGCTAEAEEMLVNGAVFSPGTPPGNSPGSSPGIAQTITAQRSKLAPTAPRPKGRNS